MPEPTSTPISPKSSKLNLSLDPKLIIVLLLVVIFSMFAMWKPWSTASSDGRTIEVIGDSVITDTPDEFIFYPSYEFKNANKDAALKELTAKSDIIIAKLKELGVASSKIKSSSSGSDYPIYYDADGKDATYTFQLTVTVGTLEDAQKIQDYLVTTSPSGMISPQTSFSDTKRKVLEEKAREEATKDARAKADQSAKNLGFKVGKVKSVTDGSGFGIMPMEGRDIATSTVPQLAVQPGENDLNYSVTVVYYLK